jgi:hypothetical protein
MNGQPPSQGRFLRAGSEVLEIGGRADRSSAFPGVVLRMIATVGAAAKPCLPDRTAHSGHQRRIIECA